MMVCLCCTFTVGFAFADTGADTTEIKGVGSIENTGAVQLGTDQDQNDKEASTLQDTGVYYEFWECDNKGSNTEVVGSWKELCRKYTNGKSSLR